MPTRTLNVLLTGDSSKMNAAFTSAISSSKLAKAGIVGAAAATAVAVGKALFDIGSEFDEVSDKLSASTGKTGDALKALEANVKHVAVEVPASLGEVGEAIGEVERRLGLLGEPLERRAKQFIELSRITETDLTGNIESVSQAFQEWHVATGKQAEKLDELYRASARSGTPVSDLATEITKFAPVLDQFNFGFDKSLELIAGFEKAGVQPTKVMGALNIAFKNFTKEGREPAKALQNVFKRLEDGTISTQRALEIFGSKGGAAIIDAADKGKLHLDEFTAVVEKSKTSINGVGEKTKDASERFQEMANRMKVLVAPAAEFVFKAVGELFKAFNTGNFKPFLRQLGLTAKGIKQVEGVAKALADIFRNYVLPVIKTIVTQVANVLKGWVQIISGVVRAISAVLHGEFGKAWKAVKEIFTGALKTLSGLIMGFSAPLRKAASFVGDAIANAFSSAWASVKGIVVDGANAVISVINSVLDAIDVIPGVPHWHVNPIGGGSVSQPGGSGSKAAEGGKRGGGRKASGAYISGGALYGDTVPAMLEHGEYVLNRNAVSAVGKGRLDELNFKVAPRRRMQFGGLADVAGAVGDVLGTAGEIYSAPVRLPIEAAIGAGKTAAGVIKGLPSGNIGGVFGGVGPWIIDRISKWIKGWFSSHAAEVGGGTKGPKGIGSYMGVPMANWVIESLQYAASKGAAPQPTSGYRSHAYNVSQGRTYYSEHEKTQYPGGAVDFGGYTSGLAEKMSVVNATRGFKYPLLAPIGFRDDGHASGTGHALGGLVRRMASGGSAGKWGNINKRWAAHWAPDYGGPTLPFFEVAALAEWAGMPGITMAQIAKGESGLRPGSAGVDPGGGSKGYGLWAITTPFNDALVSKYGGYEEMWNPVKNALAAAEIYRTQGLGAWYGTQYLTDSNAHYQGKFNIKAVMGGAGGGRGGNKGGAAKPKVEGAAGIGQGEAFTSLAAGTLPGVLDVPGVGGKIRSLFTAPGLTREGRWAASEMGLELAGETKGTADERALYQWQAGIAGNEADTIEGQIANINRQLRTRELTPKVRKHLLERRANLMGRLQTARQRGKAAREGLAGGITGDAGGAEDVASLREAIEANTAEQKATRELAATATQTKNAEAWRALADVLSGHLGARVSLQRKTAGAGKQGTF